ncbi:MAG: carboxypeptidase-like regulatory domain-containing protein [Paludibacteraceae bacterium]|nr:carboxypeptidase-like regulatory domain-containing protein [Paludibacteraceae bacterium]
MKRFTLFIISLFPLLAVCAEDLDIRSLHHLSNTMEHKEFLQMAITHDSLTRSITSAQWYEELNLVSSDTLSMQFMPTLYDIIADEYCSRRLPNRDSVVTAWLAFHEQDASVLPRLYIQLNRLNIVFGNKLLDMYDSLPESWERGYVLTHLRGYKNQQYYRYVCGYLASFPDSPFAPDILYRKHRCEQIDVDYSYPSLLSTADSLTISYSNTNAHEIIFELYRLPEKKPKNDRVSVALIKVDSLRVTTDQSLIFQQQEQQCKMKPQPFGTYFVYARVPEDTLQTPVDNLSYSRMYYRSLTVSNLRSVLMQEGRIGKSKSWAVVTDILTGQPLRHVKVKPFKQLARYTNKNGEAKISKRRSYSRFCRLLLGEDKYHQTYLSDIYDPYGKNHTDLIALPNATIFRPGDTLHIAFIGQKRHKFQTGLAKNIPLLVSVRGIGWGPKDTTVYLNEEALATMDLPFADDMRRGSYTIIARMKDVPAAVLSVRLEDYRLPSFSVAFDDSCRTMKRGSLTPVTGKAMQSNGTPLVGAKVVANVDFGRYYHNSPRPLDTVMTDMDGSFRILVPEEMVATYAVFDQMFVRAFVTSCDGETQETQILVAIGGEVPSRPKPVLVAGVPQDSLLWLPADSLTVVGREATIRLGVPRASWVYCVTSSRDKLLSRQWQLLMPGMHAYTFTLPDKTDEYLDVRFLTCCEDGTFFERHRHLKGINRTELHIVPLTMRDYLTPDARETWTFRLTDAQGNPMQGNMVLNMTDKALESIQSSLWKNPYMLKWEEPFTAFREPSYYPRSHNYLSHVPSIGKGVYFLSPVLFEPYRVDSAQLMVVIGKVVDVRGEPVVGAVISEQGTQRGTISDYDGYFSLAVGPDAVIECSFVGMKAVSCQPYSNMQIVLEDDLEALSEVITTGYGGLKGARIRGVGSIKEVETLGIAEEEEEDVAYCVVDGGSAPSDPVAMPVLRRGDTRLAFYLPDLQTDTAGEIHIRFLTPPDNTEWIMQAVAWNKDGASDYMTRNLMARRTLMLRLQMPRFMRQGDRLSLPCIISNTADTTRHTQVILQIRDAVTDSLLATFTEDLSVAPSASMTLFFPYTASFAHDIIVRAEVRDADGTSDGEQRRLAVLPIVEPVSESMPFYLHADDSLLTLTLPTPPHASNRLVTLIRCNDPLAYIAAQLPQVIDSSAVTATELIHNYYALALRNKLAKDHPAVAPVDISSLPTKLLAYRRANGAFSWLKNNRSTASYYLTLRILALLGELQEADALDQQLSYAKSQAVRYIDKEIVLREKWYREAHHDSLPDYADYALYACVRARFSEDFTDDSKRIYTATLDSLYAHISSSELTSWPLLALTFERAGQHDRALTLINGLRRYATIDHDHGMYWNNLPDRWWWYRQVDLQASFLLAFARIDPQTQELDALRQWIILNNRTTNWGQSSLNAYATYALMNGMPSVQAQEDAALETLVLPDTTTRYTIRHTTGTPAWGAIMTSFDAPADQLHAFATKAVQIERRFERSDSTVATSVPLAKGEKIRVILTITTDREMDNLILTDHRAALLEPIGVSAYNWTNNAFYYRDIRNTEERFYIEHLSRGTAVLSYECYVTASGTTLAGLASIVSELAPEFTAHTTTDSLYTK